jgi:hypothetical protein
LFLRVHLHLLDMEHGLSGRSMDMLRSSFKVSIVSVSTLSRAFFSLLFSTYIVLRGLFIRVHLHSLDIEHGVFGRLMDMLRSSLTWPLFLYLLWDEPISKIQRLTQKLLLLLPCES